jgi:uncharacterized protein GlcG (DUF336 family)
MNVQKLAELADVAVLATATLTRSGGAWILSVETTTGKALTLQTVRGETREFAKLETAVATLEEAGIEVEELTVSIGEP